jgi:hypothetical protein
MPSPLFRTPAIVPIISGQIGGLSAAHTQTGDNLLAALLALRDDVATMFVWLGYTGRVSQAAPLADGAGFKIPNGSKYLLRGRPVQVQVSGSGQRIDLAASAGSTVYVYADVNDTTGALTVASIGALDVTRPLAGQPCLGKFDVTASTCTVHDDAATRVVTLSSLAERIAALEAGGSGGGSGGSGGGAPIGDAQSILWDSPYPMTIAVKIAQLLADVEERLTGLVEAGGRRPRQTNVDQMMVELALARQGVIALLPSAGLRSQSANVLGTNAGLWGNGGNGSPDFIETELVINPDGTIEA